MTDQDPKCDKCGAPVTTGMMAAICPRAEKCAFWPADESSQEFIHALRNTGSIELTPDYTATAAIRQDGELS